MSLDPEIEEEIERQNLGPLMKRVFKVINIFQDHRKIVKKVICCECIQVLYDSEEESSFFGDISSGIVVHLDLFHPEVRCS